MGHYGEWYLHAPVDADKFPNIEFRTGANSNAIMSKLCAIKKKNMHLDYKRERDIIIVMLV